MWGGFMQNCQDGFSMKHILLKFETNSIHQKTGITLTVGVVYVNHSTGSRT